MSDEVKNPKIVEHGVLWNAIAFSTNPADFIKSKYATIDIYKSFNESIPSKFFVVDSPLAAAKLALVIDVIYDLGCIDYIRNGVDRFSMKLIDIIKEEEYKSIDMPNEKLNTVFWPAGLNVVKEANENLKDILHKDINLGTILGEQKCNITCDFINRYHERLSENEDTYDNINTIEDFFISSGFSVINENDELVKITDIETFLAYIVNIPNKLLKENILYNLKCNFRENNLLLINIKERMKRWTQAYCYGSLDSWWISYADYISRNLPEKSLKNLDGFMELCKSCGYWIPMKDFVILSNKPTEYNLGKDFTGHNAYGPAIKYPNGDKLYSYEGVFVSSWLIETPARELHSSIIVKEENAEIRRVMVQILGIEKICNELGATVIDHSDDGVYELLTLNVKEDENTRPYLKMRNPSTHTYHIEGVGVDCKTVMDALNFRKPKALRDIPVSDNGDDWYQQGDVYFWNKESKTVKPLPSILT